jgi:hypothetical protein
LDFLGFPWILSSESRLFNGLCGINREGFFHPLLSRRQNPGAGKPTIWRAEKTDCSWGKLNSISDFPQMIVVQLSTRAEARE